MSKRATTLSPGDWGACRVATGCTRTKDSVDCVAVGGIPNRRSIAFRGTRRCNEELVGWPWKHCLGDFLGDLVLGRFEPLNLRLVHLGVDRGIGAAFAGDTVVYRAAYVSPKEGAQRGQ